MVENKNLTSNTNCPNNFGCTHDASGASVVPATSAGCFSNTRPNTSNPVNSNDQVTQAQMNNLNADITSEAGSRRLAIQYATLDFSGFIDTAGVIDRIKANLDYLSGSTSGYSSPTLPAPNDEIAIGLLNNFYSALNHSETECTCVSRCTCNSRDGEGPICTCNGVCACNGRSCSCYNRTGCSTRGPVTVDCATRCQCDFRTTVLCSCNIRDVAIGG